MRWMATLLSMPGRILLGALNLLLSPVPRHTLVAGRVMPCREGGWVAAVIGGIGLVGGMVNQNKANGALDSNSQLAQAQANNAVSDKNKADKLYLDFGRYGLPADVRYMAAAEKPIDPRRAANQAVGAIDEQAPAAQAAMARDDARYGVNPNSGRALAERATFNLNTAVDKAGAATAARRQAVQQTLQNLQGAASVGNNFLSGAESFAGMTPGAFSGASATNQGTASLYGQEAAGYGQLAGYGLSSYMNSNKTPPPPPPTYPTQPTSGPPNN